MADYPCDNHRARYQGPSIRAYLNLFREEEEIRLKASVCGDCLSDLVKDWLSCALLKTENGYWDPVEQADTPESLWRPLSDPSTAANVFRRR